MFWFYFALNWEYKRRTDRGVSSRKIFQNVYIDV